MNALLALVYPDNKRPDGKRINALYARLAGLTRDLPNDDLFARMLASWRAGHGALPDCMGLDPEIYQYLLIRHFSGYELPEQGTTRSRMDPTRAPETADLKRLLLEHRAGLDISEQWLADIVAAACMGGNHLWQDLGLWSRRELSELMQRNFPSLAAKNDRDMKWKKFLYKQLCVQEGVYACRAPSCEVCIDYSNCFGPED